MLWAIFVVLLLSTPVRLEAEATRAEGWSLRLLWHVWGVPLRRQLRLSPGGKGFRLTLQVADRPPAEAPREVLRRDMALLGTLLRTDKARRSLLRALQVQRLDVRCALALGDAASTARAAGLASGLKHFLPHKIRRVTFLCVRPDFAASRSRIRARCIIFFHLGSLLPAAVMALTAALLEAREHRIPPLTEEV